MKINITIQLDGVKQDALDAILGSIDPDVRSEVTKVKTKPAPETVFPADNEPPGVQPDWDFDDAEEVEAAEVEEEEVEEEVEEEEPQPSDNRLVQDADEHVVKERFIDLADSNYDAAAGLLQKLGVTRFGELDASGHAKLAVMMDELH